MDAYESSLASTVFDISAPEGNLFRRRFPPIVIMGNFYFQHIRQTVCDKNWQKIYVGDEIRKYGSAKNRIDRSDASLITAS